MPELGLARRGKAGSASTTIEGLSGCARVRNDAVPGTLVRLGRPRRHALIMRPRGAGYVRGSRAERIYREAKVMQIGGGSTEIMKDLAARQLGWEP